MILDSQKLVYPSANTSYRVVYYIFKEREDYNIPAVSEFIRVKQTKRVLVEFKPQYNIEFCYLRLLLYYVRGWKLFQCFIILSYFSVGLLGSSSGSLKSDDHRNLKNSRLLKCAFASVLL